METQSEVLMDVRVQLAVAGEEVSTGVEDQGAVFSDKDCEDFVVVSMTEEKVLVTAGIVVPAMKDDEMEVGKCTDQEVQILPANGDGDGDCKAPVEADENGTCGAAEEEEGCGGDGKAPAMDEVSSLPRFIPVAEDNEPGWGDVRLEPILPSPQPPKRPRIALECKELDDVVQSMRNILFNLTYADDAHLTQGDEEKVRDLLEYHPKAHEKIGSGIDFIKIKRHDKFKDVRCFWVVRTDGTETDFSYHKCLKEKVAKENPGFVDRYDAIYRAPKRPRME